MDNGKVFKITASPPGLDTGIPDQNDFICIKEVDTTNGPVVMYLGGGGGNVIHEFWYLGKGDEGDKILKCYTFDVFMLIINIH